MPTDTNKSENSSAHLKIIEGLKVQPEYLFIFGILLVFATGSVLVGISSNNPSVQLLTFAVFFTSLTVSTVVIWLVINSKEAANQLKLSEEISKRDAHQLKLSEEILKLSERLDRLSNEIESACKLINLVHYGSLTFPAEQLYIIWKKLMYDLDKKFYAFSYINPDEWTQEHTRRLLSPLKSKIDTEYADVNRIFVIDDLSELQKLSEIIEYHQKYGISVSYLEIKKLYDSTPPICENPLNFGFILIDDMRLALFHLHENRKLKSIEIVSDREIFKKYEKIYERIRNLAKPLPSSTLKI
ncbi:hypothetical protein [Dolichospermum sp. UHCC 0259]|uniref:hypothetical protein n=1 Tax=Dolichospermum sp. UHCC 0259 TaxID=2590010 RepID=UPI001447BA19|nr:hypothetical protein [Dolichospermum sp. UHCC 0259]MTJ47719.1 hypothetical protein [Dolichospermum sp. UHCC 0259]